MMEFGIQWGSCKTLENKGKSSFRASEALHRMVFRAKRDPESRRLVRWHAGVPFGWALGALKVPI
jgi:hypothetical protein